MIGLPGRRAKKKSESIWGKKIPEKQHEKSCEGIKVRVNVSGK